MTFWEILLIGLGLSMDAMAVSVSNVLAFGAMSRGRLMAMPVLFGVFQGIMPLIGYFLGSIFANFISRYAGIVALVILGIIGAKMIFDAVRGGDEAAKDASLRTLLLQAVATSIDALAVGVSFCASGANIFASSLVIAATTFLCCLAAALLGRRFGGGLGRGAQIAGGVILILIGIKSVIF